ncbi:MAG: FAD-binding oxidoreductase [Parvularculales bacterium]
MENHENHTAQRIIIIGGGILGASFAYHAHKHGVRDITVLAAALPQDPRQATSNTWGWVNGYADDDRDYASFRLASLSYWPDLIADIDAIRETSKGAFFWDMDDAAIRRSVAQHQEWGHDVVLASAADTAKKLPKLKVHPDTAGYGSNDLAIEGHIAARALLEASGASVKSCEVHQLLRDGGHITGVETDQGVIDGLIDGATVIVTAGLGTPALLSGIDVDFAMRSTLGLLAYTRPLPPLLDHPITGLGFHARQDDQGRLVVGGGFGDDAEDDPDAACSAGKLIQDMAGRLHYDGVMELDHYTLGRRPLTMDGRPKIGRVCDRNGVRFNNLYMAVMHSGITNAPLAGKLGIAEVMTGKRDPLLEPFPPLAGPDHPGDHPGGT